MIVRTYKPSDLRSLEIRPYEQGFLMDIDDIESYPEILQHGAAYTLWDERPIACFGILQIKPNVGEGWLCLSKALPVSCPSRKWAKAARLIKRQLAVEMERFHRVQVAVPMNFIPGHRLVRHLGFSHESLMRKYGSDGTDFAGFVRIS